MNGTPTRHSAIAVLCIAGMIITCTAAGYSQEGTPMAPKFAAKGTTEISGTVSFSSFTPVFNGESGDAISIITFAPQVGYFFTDGFEVSLGTGVTNLAGITSISPPEGDALTLIQLFAAPSYTFTTNSETAFPFIEGMLGYTSASSGGSDVSGISYGGRAGVKLVIAEHLLLNLSGQYIFMTFNPNNADERNGFNYLNFGVGISGYF